MCKQDSLWGTSRNVVARRGLTGRPRRARGLVNRVHRGSSASAGLAIGFSLEDTSYGLEQLESLWVLRL